MRSRSECAALDCPDLCVLTCGALPPPEESLHLDAQQYMCGSSKCTPLDRPRPEQGSEAHAELERAPLIGHCLQCRGGDAQATTPFSVGCQQLGYHEAGGKLDDIAVSSG